MVKLLQAAAAAIDGLDDAPNTTFSYDLLLFWWLKIKLGNCYLTNVTRYQSYASTVQL